MRSDPRRTINLIRQAGSACRRTVDSVGKELGVTLAQYTVLSYLNSGTEFTSAALARRLEISPQSVNEIVSSLQAMGLVSKERVATNRKTLRLLLTDAGRVHLAATEKAIDRAEASLLADLSEKGRDDLRKALRDIIERGRAFRGS